MISETITELNSVNDYSVVFLVVIGLILVYVLVYLKKLL